MRFAISSFFVLVAAAILLPVAGHSAGAGPTTLRDDSQPSVAQLPKESAAPRKPAAEAPKGRAGGQQDKQAKQTDAAQDEETNKQRRMPGVTPGREAAVMTFVKQHHPELAELLVYLKASQPKEYQLAVRDLFRASERLAQIQERDFERYELELALWKVGSRVQLLSARVQMSQDEELVDELRGALNEQIDLRLSILQRDRERQADRLNKLDEQLERISSRRQQTVDRELNKLIDASGPQQKPARSPKKNDTPTPKEPATKPGANQKAS